jgi:hypothetical protein
MGSPPISGSAELITHWSLNHYSEGLMRKVFLKPYVKKYKQIGTKSSLALFFASHITMFGKEFP